MARKEYRKSKESSNPVSNGQIRQSVRGTARGCVSITICAEGSQRSSNRRPAPAGPVSAPAVVSTPTAIAARSPGSAPPTSRGLGAQRADAGRRGVAGRHRRRRAEPGRHRRDRPLRHGRRGPQRSGRGARPPRPHLLGFVGPGRRRTRRHDRPGGRAPSCSGQATAVLAFRALNGRSGARFGRAGDPGPAAGGRAASAEAGPTTSSSPPTAWSPRAMSSASSPSGT